MSRPIVLGVAALLLFAFGVIAANTRIAQGIIPVTAYEADVNKDAHINVADLGLVASKYGQAVPTATPTATLPTIVGNRAFVKRVSTGPPYVIDLINTSNNAVVRSFGTDADVHNGGVSCDGAYAGLRLRSGLGVIVVDTRTGATVADISTPGGYLPGTTLNHVVFPCALRLGAATIAGGTARTDRAIIEWYDAYTPFDNCGGTCPPLHHVLVIDLPSGATVYADAQPDNLVPVLNCAGDTMYYLYQLNTKSVSLSDGATTTMPDTVLHTIQPC